MVVEVVIGNVVVATPVIIPSQVSVAVGGVSAINSHCAVSCASEAKSANGVSVSSIKISCVCIISLPVESV